MGLDMYLRANRYFWQSNDQDKETAHQVSKAIDMAGLDVREVSAMIGQWRKANAIHNWFVNECAGGEDDCRPSYVERDKLEELREICIKLLATKDPKAAEELLPVSQGFFFGGQEYNGWYWQDLSQTVDIIDKCLQLPSEWEFEYQASW